MTTTPGIILETARLRLRRQTVSDAFVFHQLWTERDPRVPPHRQIDADGRPSAEDIAANIAGGPAVPDLLTVLLKDTEEAIGYCGLVATGPGEPHEPQLGFELLRRVHNRGYATEAGQAVIAWAAELGHPKLWPRSGIGTSLRDARWRSWVSKRLASRDRLRSTGECC